MLSRVAVGVALLLAGCLQSGTVQCGDRTCPSGTQCATVTNPDEQLCVRDDQLEVCKGKDQFTECTAAGISPGRCYDQVCLPSGCGNSRVDPDEVCDDGNGTIGDGCSYDCQSDETCGNDFLDPVRLEGTDPKPRESCDDHNVLSADGCSSSCGNEAARWTERLFGSPGNASGTAMTYDAARDRVVAFGGITSNQLEPPFRDVTWEWDGVMWQIANPVVRPAARDLATLTYDTQRRVSVLFGGRTPGGSLNDTWTWDGSSWTYRAAAGPSARYAHAVAYDPGRKKVILFGGRVGNPQAASPGLGTLGDTWEWDGVSWTEIQSATHPNQRANHALAYDPVRKVLVLAGGTYCDTWELDESGWTMRASVADTPQELASVRMVWDAANGRMLALTSVVVSSARQELAYSWDGVQWAPVNAQLPMIASADPALTSVPARGEIVLFGGGNISPKCLSCAQETDQLWRWNGSTWSFIRPQEPALAPALPAQAAALDPVNGRIAVVSFDPSPKVETVSTSVLEHGQWRDVPNPVPPDAAPPNRVRPAMAYDAARARFVLFGGLKASDLSTLLADTWLFDGTTWTQVQGGIAPPAREAAAMAYDPIRQRVLLFGGGPTDLTDTWEWDGTAWTQRSMGNIPSLSFPVMYFDPLRGTVVVYGTGPSDPTLSRWAWDDAASGWTNISLAQPQTPRGPTAGAWLPARQRLIVFGGLVPVEAVQIPAFDDTLEVSTSFSSALPLVSPGPRSDHAMVTTPDGTGVLMLGGIDSNKSPVTSIMELSWRGSGHETCTTGLDADGDGLAACADPDCWFVCTPLCPPGSATCDPSWPSCGDGACSSDRENCRNCPTDCGPCTEERCGDLYCDGAEATSCPGDCVP